MADAQRPKGAPPGAGPAASGLILAPAAWAVSTQLNYVLVPWQCAHRAEIVPWVALALAVAALSGALPATAALRRGPQRHVVRFVALLSVAASGLFAAVILLQAWAGVIFNGCETW